MIIRCYGAKGSIPVSGKQYLKYGGDTTCLEIRSKNDEIIIVDAGSGIRRLGNKLLDEQRYEYNIIFSHPHMDHILGFPFFKPIYNEKAIINLMGCPATQGDISKPLSRAMSAPFFPIQFDQLKAKINYTADCPICFSIDSIEIFPINLSHPNVGIGYKFIEDGKTFVFLTPIYSLCKHGLVIVLETNFPLCTKIGNITFVVTSTVFLIIKYSNFGGKVNTFSQRDYSLQIIRTRFVISSPWNIIFK
ncbi:MAG TPA: hypothetical protein DDW42_06770 [Desulfobacteraceae bacterium]|nr:hypothetical protein [Desulfobacteraceae bacterium]